VLAILAVTVVVPVSIEVPEKENGY